MRYIDEDMLTIREAMERAFTKQPIEVPRSKSSGLSS